MTATATPRRTLRSRFNRVTGYISVAAIGIAAYSAFGVRGVQERQNEDRVSSDLASCASGNSLREGIRELAPAVQEEVVNALADYLQVDDVEQQEMVVVVSNAASRIAAEKIIDRDCSTIPGATTTTTTITGTP